jgi:hypothetical protein
MYFDNLTLTALIFFVIGLLCVVRFCICGLCGGPRPDERLDGPAND